MILYVPSKLKYKVYEKFNFSLSAGEITNLYPTFSNDAYTSKHYRAKLR